MASISSAVVCFPMNEMATVTSVKSEHAAEAEQVLRFRRVLADCLKSF
jgi:hypothetical protein